MTQEDFEGWKEWATTKEIMRYLAKRRNSRAEEIVTRSCAASSPDDMVQVAKLAGLIMGLNELLELSYEELTT